MAFSTLFNSGCVLVLACLFQTSRIISAADEARWCTISTQEADKCASMKTNFEKEGLTPAITCVNEGSHEACMSSIANGRADLITLDGGDVFTGGKIYGLLSIMEEIYADGKKGYNALAVVRKSNTDVTIENLKDKTTCHTGYGRTAGWNIPVGFLLEEGIMPSVGCQNSLESASQFFNLSCVPGALDAAKEGADVNNLCALCSDSAVCSRSRDLYAGYKGAFRCMIERNADVAFIKTETVIENTDGNNLEPWAASLSSDDFEILCRDGSRSAITDDENCRLAPSPSHAVVTAGDKSEQEIDSYVELLTKAVNLFGDDDNTRGFKMFDSNSWSGSDLLFKDNTENLGELDVEHYEDFLGDQYLGSLDGLLKCPEGTLRFCTISDGEQEKCEAMSTAFSGADISPEISCFQRGSHADCIRYINASFADLATLDGGDIYTAGKYYGLEPVMGETYEVGDANYWAVAVVRAEDTEITINNLKDRKSCHTGIMKTAGWVVPVGYLSENDHIEVKNCDSAAAIGEFFTQSCAPGALTEKYNPLGTNPESLCQLCIGEGDDYCVRNDHEPYYDYSGAFRCLAEGNGDVAFIKHVTVDEYAGENKPVLEWNTNLQSSDFRYLCPDGTKQETWSEDCSLSKVASHALMTSGDKTETEKSEIRDVFIAGQNMFGSDDGDNFKLFDSEDYDGSNLLFKDSTLSLIEVGNRNTYDTWLSKEYIQGIKTQDPEECIDGDTTTDGSFTTDDGSTTIEVTLFALLLGLYTAYFFGGVA